MTGNDGRNRFVGLDGSDTLNGLNGDDTLAGGRGADRLLGGNGSDTADYSGSATGLTVALDGSVANTGEAVGDTFSSIEILAGSNAAGGDTLIGDVNANTIRGNAGNDSINGRAGDDGITGGTGSDTLTGDLGFKKVSGDITEVGRWQTLEDRLSCCEPFNSTVLIHNLRQSDHHRLRQTIC